MTNATQDSVSTAGALVEWSSAWGVAAAFTGAKSLKSMPANSGLCIRSVRQQPAGRRPHEKQLPDLVVETSHLDLPLGLALEIRR